MALVNASNKSNLKTLPKIKYPIRTSAPGSCFDHALLRGAVCPTYDFLGCVGSSGASGETHKRGGSSYGCRDIDRKRDRKGICWDCCVGDGHGECSAVISHVRLEDIATVEIDAAAQSSCRYRGRRPIQIQTSGVNSFTGIVVQVKFHRYALRHTAVAEVVPPEADSSSAIALDSECKTVRVRIRWLEAKVSGKGCHCDWCFPEGTGDF